MNSGLIATVHIEGAPVDYKDGKAVLTNTMYGYIPVNEGCPLQGGEIGLLFAGAEHDEEGNRVGNNRRLMITTLTCMAGCNVKNALNIGNCQKGTTCPGYIGDFSEPADIFRIIKQDL